MRVTFCSAPWVRQSGWDRAVVGGGSAAFLAVLIATPVCGDCRTRTPTNTSTVPGSLLSTRTLEHDHLNPICVDGRSSIALQLPACRTLQGIAVLGSWLVRVVRLDGGGAVPALSLAMFVLTVAALLMTSGER